MSRTALLTTIPSDAHSWNLVFMEMFLEERNWRVINLGTCVPFEQVIDVCSKEKPELVVVSTTNGHGYMEGAELAGLLRGLENRSAMKVVIGGKLGVDQSLDSQYAESLLESGFDEVFYGPSALETFAGLLSSETDVQPGYQAATN